MNSHIYMTITYFAQMYNVCSICADNFRYIIIYDIYLFVVVPGMRLLHSYSEAFGDCSQLGEWSLALTFSLCSTTEIRYDAPCPHQLHRCLIVHSPACLWGNLATYTPGVCLWNAVSWTWLDQYTISESLGFFILRKWYFLLLWTHFLPSAKENLRESVC